MRTVDRVVFKTSRHICTLSTVNLNYKINDHIRTGDIHGARKLFNQNPAAVNVVSWNSMITGYFRHDRMQHAQHLFDQMPVKDVVSWNAMLSGLHRMGNPEGVFQCFVKMSRTGQRPNEVTFSTVISTFIGTEFNASLSQIHGLTHRLALNSSVFVGSALMRGYTDLGDHRGLCQVFDEVLLKDVTTWNALLLGYMELGLTVSARSVFDMMPDKNIISWTTLFNGYINNSKLMEARSIFNMMSERNVVSWTAMIKGYARFEKFKDALELFLLMLNSHAHPNHYTFSSVLDACAGGSSLLMGNQVHSCIVKSGIPLDVILSTSLVNMYAKCGDIEAAFYIFKSMPKRNLVSWNSIIGGYARHGLANRALEEFERMVNSGVSPDRITFISVLSACGHGGLIEEGKVYFDSMGAKYGIKAGMEHYACMVDLYGRAGKLEEAESLIKGMPLEPDVTVWGALLSACGLHSCLELGEFAAEELSNLKQDHPAVYSILSKIHGEKGVWSGVVKFRKMMKQSRAKKQNAGSWIETAFGAS